MSATPLPISEQEIRTLSRWERLLRIPTKIECPVMNLLSSSDDEDPIFIGAGYIEIINSVDIKFMMFATPSIPKDAFKRLVRANKNPYDQKNLFRLFATDFQGTEWACGWTVPEIKGFPSIGWPIVGEIDSLLTVDTSPFVASKSSIELIFQPKPEVPMDKTLKTVHSIEDEEIGKAWNPGQQIIHFLDSEIIFSYPPTKEHLCVYATTSEKLLHPHVDTWIVEPLRILIGQLIYPRLVARNFGDGTAQVSLRRSPPVYKNTSIAALQTYLKEENSQKVTNFWDAYSKLLLFIVNENHKSELETLDYHTISKYYEEIIQSTQGTAWVLCLSLASACEGLAKLLMKPEDKSNIYNPDDIESLKKAIQQWEGDRGLRDRILSSLGYVENRTVGKFLRDLVAKGLLKKEYELAWRKVRHSVMHGNLSTPWESKEDEQRIIDLAKFFHNLTIELITD